MSEPRSFRKRPVSIEAMLLDPALLDNGVSDVAQWIEENGGSVDVDFEQNTLTIHTLEGEMWANAGDWIVRGVKGEFYPCKPDIFAATYEAGEPESSLREAAEELYDRCEENRLNYTDPVAFRGAMERLARAITQSRETP